MIRKPTDEEIADAAYKDLQVQAMCGEMLKVAIRELASADEEDRECRHKFMDLDPLVERLRAKDQRIEELEVQLAAKADAQADCKRLSKACEMFRGTMPQTLEDAPPFQAVTVKAGAIHAWCNTIDAIKDDQTRKDSTDG